MPGSSAMDFLYEGKAITEINIGIRFCKVIESADRAPCRSHMFLQCGAGTVPWILDIVCISYLYVALHFVPAYDGLQPVPDRLCLTCFILSLARALP